MTPLYESIKSRKEEAESCGRADKFTIPNDVIRGIKNDFREYQKEAIENLVFAVNDSLKKGNISNKFLFHMATGSGKTMVMAASILHLYTLGYRKFIYVTRLSNLVSKTRNNFIPSRNASKLEFTKKMEIDGKLIDIKEVSSFSKYNTSSIEIVLTTIADLHNQIKETKERGLFLGDLNKTVIIADEAHSFQIGTKNQSDKNEKNWESTIEKIMEQPESMLLEFTATMNFENKDIASKYQDRTLINFPLKEFREAKYSKEIVLIQQAYDRDERCLTALVVNEYRRYVAHKNNIALIPRILFKSVGIIEDLKAAERDLLAYVENLTYLEFQNFFENSSLDAIVEIKANIDDMEAFFNAIKISFVKNNSKIIHSKMTDAEKIPLLDVLNDLDSNNSNVRIIFAIDVLNEGWDVLSLFDIVKIDEVEKNISGSTTKEAQLIGRGARIFPYNFEDKDKYKRKFDNNRGHELRFLETVFFYSINNNAYISSLKEELKKLGMPIEGPDEKILIKPVMETKKEVSMFHQFLYENGLAFKNEKIKTGVEEKKMSDIKGISIELVRTFTTTQSALDETIQLDTNAINDTGSFHNFIVDGGNVFILVKALSRFSFFGLNKISSKFKNIDSEKRLIEEILEVGKDKIKITTSGKHMGDLSYGEKLDICCRVLNELERQLIKKYKTFTGTVTFEYSEKISETFTSYSKQKNKTISFNELGIEGARNMFYYDEASFDSNLEKEFYQDIVKQIGTRYESFLIVRNDVEFKLFNNREGHEYEGAGFEPDFLVFKKVNDNKVMQYFFEVKGSDQATNDKERWKEELLLSLDSDEYFEENNPFYQIVGMPFYTNNKKDVFDRLVA